MFLSIIVTHDVLINILLVLAICEIHTEKVVTSVLVISTSIIKHYSKSVIGLLSYCLQSGQIKDKRYVSLDKIYMMHTEDCTFWVG